MKFVVRRYLATPRLLRLVFEQALTGAGVGLSLATILLVTDVGRLGTLILESEIWFTAGILYFLSFAVTFAAGMIATAVLLNID